MMHEFYYWMYKGLRKIRKDENPSFDAALGVVFFINLNIIVVGRIIYNYSGFKIPKDQVLIFAIIYALIFAGGSAFYFQKQRTKIFEKINSYSLKRLKKGKNIFILYIILSFVAFFTLGILGE